MGSFNDRAERVGRGDARGFTFTDMDGDELYVWHSHGREIRVKPSASEGITLEFNDVEEFAKRLIRLTKVECPNCKGEGVV